MPNRKLRFALFSILVVAGGISAYVFNLTKYWLMIYEANPFMAIFGTGLFVILFGFTLFVGAYQRKLWWVRRKRVRITEKTDTPEEVKNSKKKSKMLDGLRSSFRLGK